MVTIIKNVSNNKNTQAVYEYIYKLANGCQLMTPQGDKVTGIAVLIDRYTIAYNLDISIRTVIRCLDELISNKHIYRYEYNRLFIYSLYELDSTKDVLARIKLSL